MEKDLSSSRPGPSTNRLWKYRKRGGFTQEQAAMILGYASGSHLSHYERGRKLPSLTTALKLSAVYDAPLEILFHDLFHQLRAELRAREARLRQEWAQHEAETTYCKLNYAISAPDFALSKISTLTPSLIR